MKKKLLVIFVVFGLFGFAGGIKADAMEYFKQLEEPQNAVEGDWWIRDVGDGEDTYTYKNNSWEPLFGNSKRRQDAQQKYKEEVYDVNVQLQKEDIDKAKKNPDEFKNLPESQVEYITIIGAPFNVTVRVPKRDINVEKAYLGFYIDDSVPKFLEPLVHVMDTSTSSSDTQTATTGSTKFSSTTDSTTTMDSGKTSSTTDSTINSDIDSTSTSKDEGATKTSTQDTTTKTDGTIESTTKKETPHKLSAKNRFFSIKLGGVLSKSQLLDLISYDGDKQNLIIEIKTTDYVYATKDAKVYHYDLNALLGKAKFENVRVMSEKHAKELGLTLSKENSDKTIETINTSLPGLYKVTFSDGVNSVSCFVTIGDLSDILDNLDNNTPVPVPTKSSTKAETTNLKQKALPKTNDSSHTGLTFLGMSIILLVGSIVFYKKYF